MAKKSRSRRPPRVSRQPERPEVRDETWWRLIFQTFGHQRYTQDSPILPEVWFKYAKADEDVQVDLILTPKSGHAPGTIAVHLIERLRDYHRRKMTVDAIRERASVAYNRSTVVARLSFRELLEVVVPMTSWWLSLPADYRSFDAVEDRLRDLKRARIELKKIANTAEKWEYLRFIVVAGFINGWRRIPNADDVVEPLLTDSVVLGDSLQKVFEDFLKSLDGFKEAAGGEQNGEIWKVSINRPSQIAIFESRQTIKADAASNLFQISTQSLAWAVIDSGIDATHPAFLNRDPKKRHKPPAIGVNSRPEHSRVVQTFDFTRLRTLLTSNEVTFDNKRIKLNAQQQQELTDLRRRIGLGREVDWGMILPLIEVPHDKNYKEPTHEHGTHVAGILAGNWPAAEHEQQVDLIGICPDLRLYDFRVFDGSGGTEEFIIMSALQVVAYLNRFRDKPVIHGVNMSVSILHEVRNYACGRTPICEECTRLVGDGVVVVAAAGNQGFMGSSEGGGQFGSYRIASVTDPGNADAVITVGATHRRAPHTYGVSYFSSRGPTGDGRRKPDLVAPGEGITAPIPFGGAKPLDGTSMAAPHVSGAAALLMARHQELIGRPVTVKQILCKSATDLGRETDFQGAGMLDILRALQSV